MRIAAIDASTLVAGVALMEDDTLVYESSLRAGLTHSQTLMPMVESAFAMAGWTPDEVDIYAAVAGPGSFTGLRIGVSTVKGMTQAVGAKTVAVGTLEVLAMGVPCFSGLCVPLLDARREQVYTAAYAWEGDGLREVFPPAAMALQEWIGILDGQAGPILLCGDGMAAYGPQVREALGERVRLAPPHAVMQRPAACAVLARKKVLAGEARMPGELVPFYVRGSSALTIAQRKQGANGGV